MLAMLLVALLGNRESSWIKMEAVLSNSSVQKATQWCSPQVWKHCRSCKPFTRLLVYLIAIVFYVCLGAWVFSRVESPQEDIEREQGVQAFEMLEEHLWKVLKYNLTALTQFMQEIEHVCSLNAFKPHQQRKWDFAPSLLFTTAVVTTVGYGNLAPSTKAGQALLIPYALVGIPLNILFLIVVGKWLSMLYQKVYKSVKDNWIMAAISYLLLVITGWCLFAIFPSTLFSSIEEWSFTESLYFTMVTLTTIGFGDYIPGMQMSYTAPARVAYDICFVIWLFFGMAYISLLLQRIGDFFGIIEENIISRVPVCTPCKELLGVNSELLSEECEATDEQSELMRTYSKLPTEDMSEEDDKKEQGSIGVDAEQLETEHTKQTSV